MKKKKNVPHGAWSNAGFGAGSPGRTSRGMTRGGFLRGAGAVAAGVGAAAVGLGGVAHAVPLPEDNPDETNIIGKIDADGNPVDRPAVAGDKEIWVYPNGNATPQQTLLDAGRAQDPNISVVDWEYFWNNLDPVTNIGPIRALSDNEICTEDPDCEWDPRERTIDAMNMEWTVNNVFPGGTVLLKSTGTDFNLGSFDDRAPGTGVIIHNSCNITGETNANGTTKIINGAGCFIGNWTYGWLAFFLWGRDDTVSCWNNYADSITIKDLVLQDVTYPGILTYDAVVVTGLELFPEDLIPQIEGIYPLNYTETNNVRIEDLYPNPTPTGGYVVVAFLFEQSGMVKVNGCYANVVGDGLTAAGCLSDSAPYGTIGPFAFEITNNEFDISSFSVLDPLPPGVPPEAVLNAGVGMIASGFGGFESGLVQNNKITMNDGPGCLSIFSHNTQYLNNEFYGTGTGIALAVWSGELGGNAIQNADFTNLNLNPWDVCVFVGEGSMNNQIVNNNYTSTGIQGWQVDMSNKLIQQGCVLLDETTAGNYVNETLFPIGTDLCTPQVADLTMWNANPNYAGKNTIEGLDSCNLGIYFQVMQKIKRASEYNGLKAKLAAMKAGVENFRGRKITH